MHETMNIVQWTISSYEICLSAGVAQEEIFFKGHDHLVKVYILQSFLSNSYIEHLKNKH